MELEYRMVLLDVDGQVYEVPLLETPRTHSPAKELEKTRKNPPKGEPNITRTPKSYASHPNKDLDKEIVSIFYRAQKPKADKVAYTNAVRKWERAKQKFSQEFKSLVKELEAGSITRNQFIARARKLFKANYELAYKLGQDSAGLQFLPLSKADLRFLERARSYEYKFLEKFARDIETKAGKMDYMDRAQMYVDATDAMFHAGRVDAYPVGGTKIYWELGPSEHCPDCYELADRSPYTPENLPTTPRAGDTRCLSRCKCSLRIRYEEPEYHDLRARAKRRTGVQTAGLDCINWRIIDDVVSCFVEWKLLESSPLEVRVPARRMLMESLQEHVRKLPAWFDPFSEDIYVLHRFGAEVIGGM